MEASQQEASKTCQCHCHSGGVSITCSITCSIPGIGQTGNTTPKMTTLPNNKDSPLTYSSIEASTGQVEIKGITSDQGEINQNAVKNLDQGAIKGLDVDQNIVKRLELNQGNCNDTANDQREIKGQNCCDSITCHNSNEQQNMMNASPVVKCENNDKVSVDLNKVVVIDDDDFKPPKKKYRVVGVCQYFI